VHLARGRIYLWRDREIDDLMARITTSKCPAYWVEREDILLLAEERQVTIPAAPGRIAAGVRKKWEACVHGIGCRVHPVRYAG